MRDAIIAAEQTGLDPSTFPEELRQYLTLAYDAAVWGYGVAFLVAGLIAVAGLATSAILVRRVTTS